MNCASSNDVEMRENLIFIDWMLRAFIGSCRNLSVDNVQLVNNIWWSQKMEHVVFQIDNYSVNFIKFPFK